MKTNFGKTILAVMLCACLCLFDFTLLSASAAEPIEKSTVQAVKKSGLSQKITVTYNGKSTSVSLKELGKMPLDLYGSAPGNYTDCVVTDIALLGGFFQTVEKKAGKGYSLSKDAKKRIILAIQSAVLSTAKDTVTIALTNADFSNLTVTPAPEVPEEKKEEAVKEPMVEEPKKAETPVEAPVEEVKEPVYSPVLYALPSELIGYYQIQGSCTTSFKGSSANRKANIATAAANLNGRILMPGEIFSVSEQFKPRTSANGYRMAGAYEAGQVIQSMGGGICQASSTTYNAAMNSGLIIVERNAHSMPVHYLPLGLDAAISAGSKDLVIQNGYSFPVVFEAYTVGNNLTVNVFTDFSQMDGYSFRFHSVKTGSLSAKSYLEVSQNGIVVEDRYIATSKYQPLSN